MRLKFAHWLMAGVFALALHAALLLTYQPSLSDSSPQSTGPRIEMADSLAGVLGQPLEVSDRPVIEKQAAAEPVETVEASEPVKLAATAPVEVPDTVTAVEAIPTTPTKKVETSEPAPTLQAKPVEEAKPKKKVKTKTVKRKKTRKTKKSSGRRTTRNRGNSKKGNAGRSKRRGRASASAIASYGSKVRSRIASAARRAGRQKGRVTVTVRISSSGRVTSVSARGPSSLTGAVKSAVRGTSFPRPPAGMGSRSFSVSISFR